MRIILAPENIHWSSNLSNRIPATAQGCGTIRDYKLFVFSTQLIKIRYQKIITTYRSGLLSSGSSSSTSRSQPYPLCLRNVVAVDSLMNSPPRFSLTSGVVMEPLRSTEKGRKIQTFLCLVKRCLILKVVEDKQQTYGTVCVGHHHKTFKVTK